MAEDRPNFWDDFFRIVTHIERALDLVKNSSLLAQAFALGMELDVGLFEPADCPRDLLLDCRKAA